MHVKQTILLRNRKVKKKKKIKRKERFGSFCVTLAITFWRNKCEWKSTATLDVARCTTQSSTYIVTPPRLTITALEFQHFLLRQIKCRGNYMKIHFASAFPRQYSCRGWQDFILRASVFTSATSAKTSTRSKLVRLLPLLHISPRIRSIMCTIIVV